LIVIKYTGITTDNLFSGRKQIVCIFIISTFILIKRFLSNYRLITDVNLIKSIILKH